MTAGKNTKAEASDAGMAAADKTKRWLLITCLHTHVLHTSAFLYVSNTNCSGMPAASIIDRGAEATERTALQDTPLPCVSSSNPEDGQQASTAGQVTTIPCNAKRNVFHIF